MEFNLLSIVESRFSKEAKFEISIKINFQIFQKADIQVDRSHPVKTFNINKTYTKN